MGEAWSFGECFHRTSEQPLGRRWGRRGPCRQEGQAGGHLPGARFPPAGLGGWETLCQSPCHLGQPARGGSQDRGELSPDLYCCGLFVLLGNYKVLCVVCFLN